MLPTLRLLPHLVCTSGPKALVASTGYHVAFTTDIPVMGTTGKLQGNTRKHTAREGVTESRKCGGGSMALLSVASFQLLHLILELSAIP